MFLSNICKKYRKLRILLAVVKLEWYIILGKFFISEYISTSTPTYLKMKKIHDINFLGMFDSYRNWLLRDQVCSAFSKHGFLFSFKHNLILKKCVITSKGENLWFH